MFTDDFNSAAAPSFAPNARHLDNLDETGLAIGALQNQLQPSKGLKINCLLVGLG